jgi:3-dehydroquinate synthase
VIKCGIIRSPELFALLRDRPQEILNREANLLEQIIAESVRIKAEVVSADEREGDLRRILNFGHTFGHALEAETGYARFLHGEAVAFGMIAAIHLALLLNVVNAHAAVEMVETIRRYGPIPPLEGISAAAIAARLKSDKKTVKGKVHFVLPEDTGRVRIVTGVDEELVLSAVRAALQ